METNEIFHREACKFLFVADKGQITELQEQDATAFPSDLGDNLPTDKCNSRVCYGWMN